MILTLIQLKSLRADYSVCTSTGINREIKEISPRTHVLLCYMNPDGARFPEAEEELSARRLAVVYCVALLNSSYSRFPCGLQKEVQKNNLDALTACFCMSGVAVRFRVARACL